MKNIGLMSVIASLGVITLLIVMTVNGRMNRSTEINSNLSSIVEETVENMAVEKKYTISNYNEYIADLVENLSYVLDTKSDITVKVINADKERGLLSIRITEEFNHPNGNRGTVECERTVVLDKQEEDEPETYTVKFYVVDQNGQQKCYKTYTIAEGDMVSAPVAPTNAYAAFGGWTDSSGYLADFTQPVTQDLEYHAVWN